jgi:Tfp pilus assembly protein PilX
MRTTKRKHEQGVALLLALLALLLLSAIAAGMMFMSGTETSIGANFKASETAYFAARAGIEEVRERMVSDPGLMAALPLLPAQIPPAGLTAIYVKQSNVADADITDLKPSNMVADDELCHDFTATYGGMKHGTANTRCSGSSGLPAGTGWYTTVLSTAPFSGGSGRLDYKWVRITLKADSSSPYPVDLIPGNANNQVCWNGISEVVLPTTGPPFPIPTSCSKMSPTALPVYLLTALAVTPSGARRMLQEEIAQTPGPTLPGGLFATGGGCVDGSAPLQIGGGAQTGSFDSSTATEGPPFYIPSNETSLGGDVGSNGNVFLNGSSVSVGGDVNTNQQKGIGACPDGVNVAGNPGMGGNNNFPDPYTPPVPPLPNPLPPQNTPKPYKNMPLPPGAYGNITLQGTITMAGGTVAKPAVYNINSLSLNGGAKLEINGPVVINLAGIGPGANPVLDLTGGSFENNTYIPSDFTINYGGSGTLKVGGGNKAFIAINAPNAAITLKGGSTLYGQVIGKTIDDSGGVSFYWDKNLATTPPPSAYYYEIAMRELSY